MRLQTSHRLRPPSICIFLRPSQDVHDGKVPGELNVWSGGLSLQLPRTSEPLKV